MKMSADQLLAYIYGMLAETDFEKNTKEDNKKMLFYIWHLSKSFFGDDDDSENNK
tara:strand:+ start:2345 stop:2509 length:165 start_codon:yes stop_codon:yes gene_type:complete